MFSYIMNQNLFLLILVNHMILYGKFHIGYMKVKGVTLNYVLSFLLLILK